MRYHSGMHYSRRPGLIAALMALFGMLFMQLAVASYACPIPASTMVPGIQSAGPASQVMPGCVEMDTAPPALCHAHDQAGKQSLDRPDLPQVQPFATIGLALTVLPLVPAMPESIVGASDVADIRANAPPLTIRNCCFLI